MTTCTIRNIVAFCQREKIMINDLSFPVRTIDGMAISAFECKTRFAVVRIGCGIKIIEMTVYTIISNTIEFQR